MYATTNRLAHTGSSPVPASDSSFLVGWPVMQVPSISPLTHRHNSQAAGSPEGFSLVEMMMVVTVILIVASIATPVFTDRNRAHAGSRSARPPLHHALLD